MAAIAIAAGGLVLRHVADRLEVMLVHRPRYDDWSFPKGKVDAGEQLTQTALREVHEETGLRCTLGPYLGHVTYDDELLRPKRAHYWRMAVVTEDPFVPNEEIDARRWASVEVARQLLHRSSDHHLLALATGAAGPIPTAGHLPVERDKADHRTP